MSDSPATVPRSPSVDPWHGHALGWLTAIFGAAVVVFLVHHVGAANLTSHLARLGWRFVPVFLLESPRLLIADGLAWWILLGYRRPRRVSYVRLCAYSLAGYAITNGTPLTDAGGEVVKAWLVAADVGEATAAAASITFAGMFAVYSSLGMVLLSLGALFVPTAPSWVIAVAVGASSVMATGGLGLLALLHIRDPASRLVALVARIPGLSHFASRITSLAAGSDTELRALLDDKWRIVAAGMVFTSVRLFQGVDAWVLLRLLGAHATLAEAFLLQGWGLVSTFVFAWLPAQLGSMEGTTLMLFDALGRDHSLAVAYELTRHVRLLSWVTLGFIALGVLTRARRKRIPVPPQIA